MTTSYRGKIGHSHCQWSLFWILPFLRPAKTDIEAYAMVEALIGAITKFIEKAEMTAEIDTCAQHSSQTIASETGKLPFGVSACGVGESADLGRSVQIRPRK